MRPAFNLRGGCSRFILPPEDSQPRSDSFSFSHKNHHEDATNSAGLHRFPLIFGESRSQARAPCDGVSAIWPSGSSQSSHKLRQENGRNGFPCQRPLRSELPPAPDSPWARDSVKLASAWQWLRLSGYVPSILPGYRLAAPDIQARSWGRSRKERHIGPAVWSS